MPVESPLLTIPNEQVSLAQGLRPDAGDEQMRFWADGRNVQFRNGGIESVAGYSALLTPTGTDPVRGAVQQRMSNLSQRLYWGDAGAIYKWGGGAVSTEGSGYTGIVDPSGDQRPTIWSMVVWGDWILAVNGVDLPQIDQGSGFVTWTESDSSALPFSDAEILIKRGPHVLAINTSNGFNWIEWCSQDDVRDWTPTAENSAGNLVVRDVESELIAAEPLGERIAVYSADSLTLVSYLGSPNYFGFSPAVNGIGAVGKLAVVPVGRKNFGLGRQGIWQTDGVQHEYIDRGFVRDYLQDAINWTQAAKISAMHDQEFTRVVWSYPTGNNIESNESVAYDYLTGQFTFFDFAWTTGLEREVFADGITFDSAGKAYALNSTDNADGSVLKKWARTKPLSFGQGSILTLLDAVVAGFASKTGNVEYRVGVRDRLDDAPVWGDWILLPSGKAPTYPNVSGRWIELEFRSNTLGASWGMDTLTLFGAPIGGSL